MIKLLAILKEAKDTIQSFSNTRMEGAKKIADEAKEKSGLALLTWHHFKVKLPYYKKAAAGKFNVEKSKEEYGELLEKLYTSTKSEMKISQIQFQELVGKIEVLGELLIKED